MKILFILDPLDRLNVEYDSSLAMIRNFTNRGHHCFFADASDLFTDLDQTQALCRRIFPKKRSLSFAVGKREIASLKIFDAVLTRKEPPFSIDYVYMTYLLDFAARDTLIVNPPQVLRDANEKLSTLNFPKLIPPTRISGNASTLLAFQNKLRKDLILKPLDERGGRGICILKRKSSLAQKLKQIQTLTRSCQTPILAQEFIQKPDLKSDKRIFLLDGKLLVAYERYFARGDFRGNLSQGASYQKTRLTHQEKRALSKIIPWVKSKKIHFVGIDLLDGKLLEINITCPGGFPEADLLHPELKVFDQFSDSVERLAKKHRH